MYYCVDPTGEGSEKKVAESVVLHRWRRRVFPGYTFSGSRLSPKLWRVLPVLFGENPRKWLELSSSDLAIRIDASRESLREDFASLPGVNILLALFQVCGVQRLEALLLRHNSPLRSEKFGTPDLFLFATRETTNQVNIARFVEVKKPKERLSADQREEIEFLQSLGLHARVLRLHERNT